MVKPAVVMSLMKKIRDNKEFFEELTAKDNSLEVKMNTIIRETENIIGNG